MQQTNLRYNHSRCYNKKYTWKHT